MTPHPSKRPPDFVRRVRDALFTGGGLVFLVALVVRLAYLVGYRSNPFFADPQMDALYHDRWAMSIARGDWIGAEVFFRAPLYPYFLGTVYAIFGHSYLMARVIQAVVGALSCVLVFRIGRRFYGPVVGVVAGVLAALLAASVYYEAELLLVVLETFLSLLALDRLLIAADGSNRLRVPHHALLAGVALGLAAITRPNFLVIIPLAILFLLRRLRRHGRTVWALALMLYLAGAAAPIGVVLVRNFAVGGDFVPIASQGGLNFYLGNNAAADGMAALAPEFRQTWYGGIRDAERLAEEAVGKPLKPSEVSDYWLSRGLNWIRANPLDWMKLTARKAVLFWQAFEIPNNEDFYYFNRYSFLFRNRLLLMFGAIAPLALAGFVLGFIRKNPARLLALFVALFSATVILFFVCGRFRAPVIPVLCIPAAYFIVDVGERLRRGGFRSCLAPLAVFAAAAIFVNADFYRLGERHTFAESWLRVGIFHASRGRPDKAEAAYRSAIQEDPGFAEGHNNLGVLLMQRDRTDEALAEFTRALEIDPAYPRTINNMAAWYEHTGNLELAREYIDRALVDGGDEVEVRYNAGVIYGRLQMFAESAAHFRRLLDIEPGHVAGRLGLGKSLLMEGEHLEAASAFSQVVERDPRHAEALYFLGLARVRMRDLAGARRAWEECLLIRPDYEAARRQLDMLTALPPSLRSIR